jgi:hypothetical protein
MKSGVRLCKIAHAWRRGRSREDQSHAADERPRPAPQPPCRVRVLRNGPMATASLPAMDMGSIDFAAGISGKMPERNRFSTPTTVGGLAKRSEFSS